MEDCFYVNLLGGCLASSQNAELSLLFTFSVPKVSMSTVTGIGGVVVAKRRTVVTFWTCLVSSRQKNRPRGGLQL